MHEASIIWGMNDDWLSQPFQDLIDSGYGLVIFRDKQVCRMRFTIWVGKYEARMTVSGSFKVKDFQGLAEAFIADFKVNYLEHVYEMKGDGDGC